MAYRSRTGGRALFHKGGRRRTPLRFRLRRGGLVAAGAERDGGSAAGRPRNSLRRASSAGRRHRSGRTRDWTESLCRSGEAAGSCAAVQGVGNDRQHGAPGTGRVGAGIVCSRGAQDCGKWPSGKRMGRLPPGAAWPVDLWRRRRRTAAGPSGAGTGLVRGRRRRPLGPGHAGPIPHGQPSERSAHGQPGGPRPVRSRVRYRRIGRSRPVPDRPSTHRRGGRHGSQLRAGFPRPRGAAVTGCTARVCRCPGSATAHTRTADRGCPPAADGQPAGPRRAVAQAGSCAHGTGPGSGYACNHRVVGPV